MPEEALTSFTVSDVVIEARKLVTQRIYNINE